MCGYEPTSATLIAARRMGDVHVRISLRLRRRLLGRVLAALAALARQRATVFHDSPFTLALAEMLTPSTCICATSSKVFREYWSR